MMATVLQGKARLDHIINISRVDLYKPIQIAEVLRRSRINGDVDISKLETYRNRSKLWRDEITILLTGKRCTSSMRFQDDIWNENAFPQDILSVLDAENRRTNGAVEKYIYKRYSERHSVVGKIISMVIDAKPRTFKLNELLELFEVNPGIRRSIDKAYEIVTYALFETVVVALGVTVTIDVPDKNFGLLREFSDLAKVLLGIDTSAPRRTDAAHIYRVGVTNAADRGLDMWANFGPAVQVKHLTLNPELAKHVVDQVESDHIVVVCRVAERDTIQIVTNQTSWGKRVRGIVTESDLNNWYERALRGEYSSSLATPLLETLRSGFAAEFPQSTELLEFFSNRGYDSIDDNPPWICPPS